MRFFISIFIIFTIAIRPVLPLLNYVFNYDYIVKNLCEKKNIPQSTCNGKCYLEKELAKTEKQSDSSQPTIKLLSLDVFLSNNILCFTNTISRTTLEENTIRTHIRLYSMEHFSRIFHPPLI
ncbi:MULTISPECIES: hypothetical protein [Chryseobacterium]|uniref:Uncharacterized protein n=2 Tax=Chryseobacterium TaxID=59732 RepID=A0A3M7TBY9_9FLAO|nr:MULTISPECIES: hypothetical protein [Chryseobacterium]RNA60738.1 hypothetical protein D1631_01715 [Chryseobacterium nematophagum]CAA7387116.1 hypothetical protein CHRY9393_01422 [Chryseobacterium fistulae]